MCGVCDIDAKGSGNDCRDLEVSCTIPKPLTVLVHQDKDYWLKNEPLDWKWNQLERECNAIIVLPESVGELRLDQPMGNDDIVIYATYEPSQKHHDSARNLHNKPYWWPCTIKMTYQCVECDINLKNSVDDCSGTRWGKYNFWLQNFWLHSKKFWPDFPTNMKPCPPNNKRNQVGWTEASVQTCKTSSPQKFERPGT